MPNKYTITGAIKSTAGERFAGLNVLAFDRDLPSRERRPGYVSQPLGTAATVDAEGCFEITYTLKQFQDGDATSRSRRPGKQHADISFQVFDQHGRPLTITRIEALNRSYQPDEVIMNAPDNLEVRLYVAAPQPQTGDSEIEKLQALIAPVIEGLPLAELSEDDLRFLIAELGLEQDAETQRNLEWMRRSALLAQDTSLPVEAFYGWGRENVPQPFDTLYRKALPDLLAVLEQLLSCTEDELRKALKKAADENIIPARFGEGLEGVDIRLAAGVARKKPPEEGRPAQHPWVSGRLLDAGSGAPLVGYRVQAALPGGKAKNRVLPEVVSGPEGRFDMSDPRLADVQVEGERGVLFVLQVLDPQGQPRPKFETYLKINTDPQPVMVPRMGRQSPSPVKLSALAEQGGPQLTPWLSKKLPKLGMQTLSDVWTKGGAANLKGLPEDEREAARLLDAHADLFRLSPDIRSNAALIQAGYDKTTRIAAAPPLDFLRETRPVLGDATAMELHSAALAERNVLRAILAGGRAEDASRLPVSGPMATKVGFSQKCTCQDCETAVSPLAYLADLLDYSVDHVFIEGKPISLGWLAGAFYQPFGDLPADCDAMDAMVRQVRLCVEVLRRKLSKQVISPAAARRLMDDEKAYRLAAYAALLGRLGTSFEELRLARDTDPDDRQELATRLGFSLDAGPKNRLDALTLDPDTMTEADLERLFGLVDTRPSRDPLSDGPVFDDPQNQVTRWDVQGIEWRRTTDDEGLIHLSLEKQADGSLLVELFRNSGRAAGDLVASGQGSSPSEAVALVSRNQSGLSGTIDIHYTADSAAIALGALPRLLAWRLAHLREDWADQDHPAPDGRPQPWPVIDPDLVNLGDLRDPLSGPAADLWHARRSEIDKRLADLSQARLAQPSAAAALDAALMFPDSLMKTAADLVKMEEDQNNGKDIRTQLDGLFLTQAAFEMLLRVHKLVSAATPDIVLESEWAAVDAILAQVYKSRKAGDWRKEELTAEITLGPDFFAQAEADPFEFPAPQPVALPDWLATREARRAWERTLKARTEQQQETIQGLYKAVGAAEEAMLYTLRDALITAVGVAGNVDLAAKKLTDELLIDCANGACQMTTRIAQAIETIQLLLYTLRTGQLLDTYPNLALNAPNFDEEWQWIGSFAPWRAAMLVFFYTENVLHPALRDRQSPGFKRLVHAARGLPAITPENACQLAADYSAYFKAVCQIKIEASTRTITRVYRGDGCRGHKPIQDRAVLHMLGRPYDDGNHAGATVFWATFDEHSVGDQVSFWDWVPGLEQERVVEIIGTTTYVRPNGSRALFVFVKVQRMEGYALVFTRYDLLLGSWETGNITLQLPAPYVDFEARLLPHAETEPPRLILRQPPGGGKGSVIYRRSLNLDGSGWAAGEWFPQFFSPWYRIGSLEAKPGTQVAVASTEAERIDLLTVNNADGGVYHSVGGPDGPKVWVWREWMDTDVNFSAPLGSPVTVIKSLPNLLELFVVGIDHQIYQSVAGIPPLPAVSKWTHWAPLGGPNIFSPLTPLTAPDNNSLIMLDQLGHFRGAYRSPDGVFGGWKDIIEWRTNALFLGPGPVVAAFGRYFGVGTDRKIYSSNGQFDLGLGIKIPDWAAQGDLIVSQHTPLSIIASSNGRIDLFAVGEDGGIHQISYNTPDGGKWTQVGGLSVPPGAPVATLGRGPTHQDLFVIGKEGRVYHAWWDENANNGKWNEWFPISSQEETFPALAPITVVERRPGHFDLFIVGNDGGIYSAWWDENPDAQWPVEKAFMETPPIPYRPLLAGPSDLPERLNTADLQIRRAQIRTAYTENMVIPMLGPTHVPVMASTYWVAPRIMDCLDEAYYFAPILLALQLQRVGHFPAALDWYRTVYDFSVPLANREIAYLLSLNKDWTHAYERAQNWLDDPLNPHRIAAARPFAYLRYTLLALIQCFLEAGDAEYTQDTNESIPRARTYYLTALELLNLDVLRQQPGSCEALLAQVKFEIGEGHEEPVLRKFVKTLSSIGSYTALEKAVGALNALPVEAEISRQRLMQIGEIVQAAAAEDPRPTFRMADALAQAADQETQSFAALLAVPEIEQAAGRAARLAGERVMSGAVAASGLSEAELRQPQTELPWLASTLRGNWEMPEVRDLAGSIGNGDGGMLQASVQPPWYTFELVGKPEKVYVPAPSAAFCVPPNPVLKTLRLRAAVNLDKLRHCRNIAGMERQLELYTAPTDPGSNLPSIGSRGQLVLPGLSNQRPTPYHYSVLIERAKQLVQLSAMFEASMLASIEKSEAEKYMSMMARQDSDLLQAQVRLEDLRIRESESSLLLAHLQEEKAQTSVNHWQDLLHEGISSAESASIGALYAASALYTAAAKANLIATNTPSFASFFSFGASNWSSFGAAMSSLGQVASTQSQIQGLYASYERRRQDWQYQRSLAQADVQIANQSVSIAQNHLAISHEERLIAGLHADNAAAMVNFLANKFTNQQLYDWMGGVLEGVYRWFLQQAATMARLAEIQLAFERQDALQQIIQGDYWDAPSDRTSGSGKAPDRRGLTGSARLLQDIYELDQYAFTKNVRKLQLTKTISLGQLAPIELERFRHTGVLPFATTLEMFDRDFPGHYLRLIKSVRTSVVALVPPTLGIRATLSCTGVSRVVVAQDGGPFQTVIVRRDPQLVALSSPLNASGVFDLDPQPDLLMPFVDLGVETNWELRMLPASNPFDFSTVVDILLTYEYTALHSEVYAAQVMRELDNLISYDRSFSFRIELSDAWCDLHSPDQTGTRMKVHFKTTRADFAPNLNHLMIQNLALSFTFKDDQDKQKEITVKHLRLSPQDQSSIDGGPAGTVEGLISTRQMQKVWGRLLQQPPIGDWELELEDTPAVRALFEDERITDMMLVITYTGEAPTWPA